MDITFTDARSKRANTFNAIQSCSIVSLFFALVSFCAVAWSLFMVFTTEELGKPVAVGGIGVLLLLCSYLISNLAKAVQAKVADDDRRQQEQDMIDMMERIEDRCKDADDGLTERIDEVEARLEDRINEVNRDLSLQMSQDNENIWRNLHEVEMKVSDRKK
jgi:hypothetical protein